MNFNFIIFLLLFRKLFFYSYEIIDGIENSFRLNKTYYDYYFYIRTNKSKHVLFSAKIANSCKLSSSVYIYEYDSTHKTYSSSRLVSINGKITNNICEYFYKYTILSSNVTFVDFRCSTSRYYNKDNITIRMDLEYEEYKLSNGQSLELFNLYLRNSYYLYLDIFESADISFIINNISQIPFSNINIHEFGDYSRRINIINKPISFKTDNNQIIASFSYSERSNLTKYIALQVKPSFNISHFIVKFKYPITSIDLNDGIWKTIDNLNSKEIYFFFIEVKEWTKINISLMINNTDNEYDDELPIIFKNGAISHSYQKNDNIPNYIDINVYEYEKKNNTYTAYIQNNTKTLIKERDFYFKTQRPFRVNSSSTTYLAFTFKPNYNISQMLAKIDISGGIYELFKNTSKNITKLKSDDDYFFFTEAKRFNFIKLTLTINNDMNLTTNPFAYVYSEEKSDRRNYYNNYYKKNTSISSIINGDQQIVTITQYMSDSEYKKYINFIIRPSYNIDYMLTNIEITDCLIDLNNYNYSKKIYNIKRNIIYYIKMNAWTNYKTNLNLKIYNLSSPPFYYIQIYDCSSFSYLSLCEKNITKKINFEKTDNSTYEAIIEKENTLSKHIFLLIRIISEYDINMVAETRIIENFNTKISTTAVILIIIEVIFIIFSISYIIYHIIKCRLSKSKDLSLASLAQNSQNEFIIHSN